MRTRVLLLPGALEPPGQRPIFEPSQIWNRLLSRGHLFGIHRMGDEAAWLGLDSSYGSFPQGPLTAAALEVDPPDRSVQFHLSPMSFASGVAAELEFMPTDEEVRVLFGQAQRLETSRLKVVEGRELDHCLVWEDGSIELSTQSPAEAVAKGYAVSFPKGDGEPLLRRLIDDSVNLLSELEMNRVREQEGLPPINLLWPWGHGFRPRLPNLTVERGASVKVESPLLRLKGLSRLAGYRHGDPYAFGRGTSIRLGDLAQSANGAPLWLGVIPAIGEFHLRAQAEEAYWLSEEVVQRLLEPLLLNASEHPSRILLIATDSSGDGLVVDYRSDGPLANSGLPFRTELMAEKSLARREGAEVIREALTP